MNKTRLLRCPVCGKPLTQSEYEKALGLWDAKQAHIRHLEADRVRLKEQEKVNLQKLREERIRLRQQERLFKQKVASQTRSFKREQAAIRREAQRTSDELLARQRLQIESRCRKSTNR
jgi:hypothetical protein